MEAIAQLMDTTLVAWLASPAGAVVFVPLYAIWVTLLLPGICLDARRALWNLVGAIVFAGATLGAEAVFWVGTG